MDSASTSEEFSRPSSVERKGRPNLCDPTRKHDRVIKVGGKNFYVNKTYLCTWSRYLNSLLDGGFVEQNQTEIEIKAIDPDVFELFLQTIYPGETNLTFGECQQLLEFEPFLAAEALIPICAKRIIKLYDLEKITLNEALQTANEFKIKHIVKKLCKRAGRKHYQAIADMQNQIDSLNVEMVEEFTKGCYSHHATVTTEENPPANNN